MLTLQDSLKLCERRSELAPSAVEHAGDVGAKPGRVHLVGADVRHSPLCSTTAAQAPQAGLALGQEAMKYSSGSSVSLGFLIGHLDLGRVPRLVAVPLAEVPVPVAA